MLSVPIPKSLRLKGSSALYTFSRLPAPFRAVTVSGLAQWSLEEQRLAEAKLQALWQVTQKIQLSADVARTSPDLFLDRSSIFAVLYRQEMLRLSASTWSLSSAFLRASSSRAASTARSCSCATVACCFNCAKDADS